MKIGKNSLDQVCSQVTAFFETSAIGKTIKIWTIVPGFIVPRT